MSSLSTTEPQACNNDLEQTHLNHLHLNTNKNTMLVENNTIDETTHIDTTTFPTTSTSNQAVPVKTQVLPVVYFQAPQKLGFTTNTKSNSMIVNSVPQFQFASLGANTTNKSAHNITLSNLTVSGSQSVILAPFNNQGKPQQIVIQKPGNVLPAYLTMVKSVNKEQPSQVTTPNITNLQENIHIVTSSSIQGNCGSKYVIAPMPKLTANRLPATMTTNSVQPKITFMPLSVPTSSSTDLNISKQKIFNFKIADGQIQPGTPVKIIPNFSNQNVDSQSSELYENESDRLENNLICDEVMNLESPEKDGEEKSYELSIDDGNCVPNTYSANPHETVIKLTQENKLIVHKEPPKFPKHGVSILKKNYSTFVDRRSENVQNTLTINKITNNNNNLFSEISKVDVTLGKPCSTEETVILTEPKTQKPERRRKSNFCYRKDYDDMEIETFECNDDNDDKKPNVEQFKQNFESADIVLTKLNDSEETDANENDEKLEGDVEMELIKEKDDSHDSNNIKNNSDLQKMLKWEDGIGTLPGSNLKFIVNEFDLIEYVPQDEYNKIIEKRIAKAKERASKDDFNEVIQCTECGCYGLPSEFISPKYCSYDCQETGDTKAIKDKEAKLKKKKKRPSKKNTELVVNDKIDKDSASEEDDTSNENSQDKLSYPWACSKKGFSWTKYLEHVKAKAAPLKLFKDPFPYTRNGFRSGMKLEGIDPQHPSYFCVLTVSEVIGYRIRLHFDGYPDNYDFWLNADSMDIFPVGWCEKYGHDLHPPPGYTINNFNWVNYLKQTRSTAAPKHLFANRAGNAICPNGFRVGMKLEAVDKKNTSLVCVASIRDMMDNRILVHFDSWDDIYDYWADPTSPYIHPVGWCDQYGHRLTPPNENKMMFPDYPNPESFTWETYLKETKSVAAPVRAFKQRQACGFKKGMRLECVDKRVPQVIRAATVDDVRDHQIRIYFDGWPDRYAYWVDDDSPDIHPVGWCQKTGHPLESPLTPDDIYDFLECPTVGCKGIGHIKGAKYGTHSIQKYCPYAEENIDAEKVIPDRLLSPDLHVEAVVPVSREPKERVKPRPGRPPKFPRLEQVKEEPESSETTETKPLKRKFARPIKEEVDESEKKKATEFLEQSKVIPVELASWPIHSKFLKRFVKEESDPIDWSVSRVQRFIQSLPNCAPFVNTFKEHDIDGEALLSLSQVDIIDIMKVKIGPAIKIYNSIVLLRQNTGS